MKIHGWKMFKVLAMSLLLMSVANATDLTSQFDTIKMSESGTAKVGIRSGRHRMSDDPLEGDLMWIKEDGTMSRIGGKSAGLVVFDNGVLGLYYNGRTATLEYWSADTGKFEICMKDISVKDIKKKDIKFTFGKKFIQYQNKLVYKNYQADCKDSGKIRIYMDLTSTDRETLDKYGPLGGANLTDPQVNEVLPEILGRDEIVDSLIANLRNEDKRSTLLWGPPGIGKTAIVYRLARRIVEGDVPEWLKDWSIYNIDFSKLSEEGLKGKAQQKMSEILAASSGKKVILLMDEIHQLIGLGAAGDSKNDVTEILKTDLANGRLAIIGSLTDNKNEMALMRTKEAFYTRFNRLPIDEPNDDVLKVIFTYKAKKLLKKYNVTFSDKMLKNVLELTRQYVPKEKHPRLGLTIMDNVSSKIAMKREKTPERDKVYAITIKELKAEIGLYGNIISLMDDPRGDGRSFIQRVRDFEKDISKKYVGQRTAIDTVSGALNNYAAGLAPEGRPGGIFLFLGPSGVGKSYLAKLVAKQFRFPYKQFPMAQFRDEASSKTLLGAPPTYVGYNPAGGLLTQWINDNPASVLNFDEIDKAHTSVFESLMNLMDEGIIMDSSGIEARFNNGFLFFTSNFEMRTIRRYDVEVLKIGQDNPNPIINPSYDGPRNDADLKEFIMNKLMADGKMGTYMTGRVGLENIVLFHHLTKVEAKIIAGFEVKKALAVFDGKDYEVVVDDAILDKIVKDGYNFDLGARPVRGLTVKYITSPLSRKIVELRSTDTSFKKLTLSLKVANGIESFYVKVN
jgi:ATP-dependent Clp protease ATP-binding subunit ClpA